MSDRPMPDWSALNVGDELARLQLPPITRTLLAIYCGASGDHNPIHVDIDYARSAGLPDVFAHGMLSAAWLARLLTNWVPQSAIRSLDVRFVALTRVGDVITCTARVSERSEQHGERRVRLQLTTADQLGQAKVVGEAVVAWPNPC